MCYHCRCGRRPPGRIQNPGQGDAERLLTDGGDPDDETGSDGEADGTGGENGDGDGEETPEDRDGAETDGPHVDRANVEVTEADSAEPATPEWDEPDLDDIPDFELGAEGPVTRRSPEDDSGAGEARPQEAGGGTQSRGAGGSGSSDSTAGMPNTARTPAATRISSEGTEAYIVAFELCAQLPEDVRLPEEAADLVPTAVEAELEQDIQSFAASEFDTSTPHVDTLSFEEIDGEIWLRLRIGLPAEGFADLDPEAVRSYALEQLEGVF